MTPWFRRVWSAVVVIGLGLASVSAWAMEAADLEPTGPQPWVLDDKGGRQPLYKASHALLISVSNYKAWPELRTTKAELDEVARELQKHGFRVRRVHDPSGDELKREVDRFFGRHGHGLGSQDHRLLFFFSGHGHTNQQSDYAYLVPMDAANPDIDPSSFYEKALPIDGLDSKARGIQVRHALFLFDSCFSGGIFASRSQDGNAVPQAGSTSERLAYLNLQRSEPVRQFIAAGKHNETVPARSQFAPGFLKALQGRAAGYPDGYVTGKEIGRWLEQTVPGLYQGGRDKPTHPHSGVSRDVRLAYGDMVFQIPGLGVTTAMRPPEGGETNAQTLRSRESSLLPLDQISSSKRYRNCKDLECPRMVVIPAGKFLMGASKDKFENIKAEISSYPIHHVSVKSFLMSEVEVTWGFFKKFLPHSGGRIKKEDVDDLNSRNVYGDDAAAMVTWIQAKLFIDWLNSIDGPGWRLPSEAEWEYSCKAGGDFKNCGDDDPDKVGWQGLGESLDVMNIRRGAQKKPNAWGLYDMTGNVEEWVEDCYHKNYINAPVDGRAWVANCEKYDGHSNVNIIRGGNLTGAENSAISRDIELSDEAFVLSQYVGFRIARSISKK